jgi:hypothetical protein
MSAAEMNPFRKHACTDVGTAQLPEPTYAERVRILVSSARCASLNRLPQAASISVRFSCAFSYRLS